MNDAEQPSPRERAAESSLPASCSDRPLPADRHAGCDRRRIGRLRHRRSSLQSLRAAERWTEWGGLPDERRLYIVETGLQFASDPERHLRVFEVQGARLVNGRSFHALSPGDVDGFRCDVDGNLRVGAGDGVHCIDPSGALVGRIGLPVALSNLTSGGRHRSRLFLCAGSELFVLTVNQRGCQWP